MKTTQYFNPQTFVDDVIEAMKLGETTAPVMLELRKAVEKRLSDRIIITILDSFEDREMKLYERLLADHQELDDIDVLMMIAPQIPGIREKMERGINSLYFELTREAEEVEKGMNVNT